MTNKNSTSNHGLTTYGNIWAPKIN